MVKAKTVDEWRKRQIVEDQKTGPKEPRSNVLCKDEEALVVALRRHTLLPLDDPLCIAACSVTGHHALQAWMGTSPNDRSSNDTPLAQFISTSPKSEPKKVSFFSL